MPHLHWIQMRWQHQRCHCFLEAGHLKDKEHQGFILSNSSFKILGHKIQQFLTHALYFWVPLPTERLRGHLRNTGIIFHNAICLQDPLDILKFQDESLCLWSFVFMKLHLSVIIAKTLRKMECFPKDSPLSSSCSPVPFLLINMNPRLYSKYLS